MPSLDWNKKLWDGSFNWEQMGEQWSTPWGGSEAQWFGSLYPRLHSFLPCNHILEIAPGFGRWTKFLLGTCEDYTGIDLSAKCVDYCRTAFKRGSFVVNDGRSLNAVPDNSIDVCFSFDSLVHAEMEVFESYIPQILRKLTKGGIAFIHHSNWAAQLSQEPNVHNRALTVSAKLLRELIQEKGGHVLIQESLNWGRSPILIDALTTFCRQTGAKQEMRLIDNPRFMEEASMCKSVISVYSGKQ